MQKLLRQLFDAYYKDIYTYLYSLCRDAALAEDLTGEVFLEAVRSIGGFRAESDPKTWLFSIARHRWYRHLRQKNRRPQTEALSEFLESCQLSPEQQADHRELARRIRELILGEPERTQGILAMRMDGYSFHEIGRKFGISENSARVIDFRAKAKIRAILKQEGFCNE